VSVAEKLRMQRQWSLEFEDEYRRLRQQAREAR